MISPGLRRDDDDDDDDDNDDDDERFYIALFSALEQTHCTFVPCDSKRLTSFFIARFSFIHLFILISTEVV